MEQTLIQYIENIARNQNFSAILKEVEDLQYFAGDDKFLDVVVLGQFKAGKSSLVNDLLGRALLPVGVLPVTAVITRVFYGKQEKAIITRLDGEQFEIDLDDLPAYVTEKQNPENTKQVYLVDVSLPSLKSYSKLRFIDTPGLGSAFKHNTTVTENWFNKIGVALVVISAVQPLSENDLEVIASAAAQSPEVHLVLSKMDLLSKGEQEEVVEFLLLKAKENLGRSFRVFPYSIMKGNEQFKESIRREALQPLVGDHGTTRQIIYNHKLKHLTALTRGYLEIRLQMAGKEENERQSLKDKILDEQMQLQFVQKELAYIARNYEGATREKLEKLFLEERYQTLLKTLETNLQQSYSTWNGNLYAIARNYEVWLKQGIKDELQKLEQQTRPFVQQMLDGAQQHFNHYTSLFRERLNHRIEEILQVSLPPEEFSVSVEPLVRPDISTSWAFESHIDMLWFLIPMSLFRKTFLKSFLRQLPSESEKNLRRLVSILTKNINKAIEQSHSETLEYIRSRLNSIEQLLAQQTSNVAELNELLSELDSFDRQETIGAVNL